MMWRTILMALGILLTVGVVIYFFGFSDIKVFIYLLVLFIAIACSVLVRSYFLK